MKLNETFVEFEGHSVELEGRSVELDEDSAELNKMLRELNDVFRELNETTVEHPKPIVNVRKVAVFPDPRPLEFTTVAAFSEAPLNV